MDEERTTVAAARMRASSWPLCYSAAVGTSSQNGLPVLWQHAMVSASRRKQGVKARCTPAAFQRVCALAANNQIAQSKCGTYALCYPAIDWGLRAASAAPG